MTKTRRRARVPAAAAAALVCLVMAGCSGGSSGSAAPAPSSRLPSSVSSGPPTTTASAGPNAALKRLIVGRYVLFVRTMDRLGQSNDINSAALRDVATGNQLIASIESLTKASERGLTSRGEVELRPPTLEYLQPDRKAAVVRGCGNASTVTQYKGGKALPRSKDQFDGVKATMFLVDGVWKVGGTEYTVGRCS